MNIYDICVVCRQIDDIGCMRIYDREYEYIIQDRTNIYTIDV